MDYRKINFQNLWFHLEEYLNDYALTLTYEYPDEEQQNKDKLRYEEIHFVLETMEAFLKDEERRLTDEKRI